MAFACKRGDKAVGVDNKKGETEFSSLKRKTLYVTETQDIALRLMKACEKKDEYQIVIEALNKHIPQKYIDMAAEGISNSERKF